MVVDLNLYLKKISSSVNISRGFIPGADSGGGAPRVRPPLKKKKRERERERERERGEERREEARRKQYLQ